MRLRTLALAGLTSLLTACGITGNFRNDPGYADFGPLQRLDAESDFGLSLGPLPLKIATWVTRDDEDIGPLLRELRAVRVYTMEGIADPAEAASRAKQVTANLSQQGWLTVAAVRDGEEVTSVLLRPDGDFAHKGLAVIVQEPDEVVLVNLIGEIRLDFINGYLADLDVDVPQIEIDPTALQAALSHPASPAAGIGP
jgi:uncharacterized protein DUF4252